MNEEEANQGLNYFQQLTQANPLQKKTLKNVFSIFPQIQLPEFKYLEMEEDLLTGCKDNLNSKQKNIRSRTLSPKKYLGRNAPQVLYLEETELSVIFQNPAYSYNKRLSHGSNKNFCNLRVFEQQSHYHQNIQENERQFYQNKENSHNLQFQSRFQSGNLAMATQSLNHLNQYYLVLTKDYNTALCTQWFFFRVLNKKKGKYTFHILNFFKNYSSFQYGMQLCVSLRSGNFVWRRGGTNIKYRKTNLKSGMRDMYALSFSYEFESDQDMTYFSYSFPYTYSQLDKFLFKLQNENSNFLKRRAIGTSSGGNTIDMVTITNFKASHKDKKLIFITSRVHPGETPSSFVMQGIIKKLIENNDLMQNARQKFIFRLIPMINPDGVINGNYRCGLSGYDLNRIWNVCSKDKYPEIFCIKKVLQSSKKPFLFIDLHAHSKKKGIFMYGCSLRNNPFLCREIPFLFWKKIKQFNYYQCNFSTKAKKRDGTARMNVFRQFGVNLSYTMQHSFCGPLKQRKQFTAKNYKQIGQNLVLTLQRFYGRRKAQNSNNQNDLSQILKQLYQNKQLLKVGQNDQNQSSSDSELQVEFEQQNDRKNQKKWQKFRPQSKLQIQHNTDNQFTKTPRQRFSHNFVLGRVNSFREKSGSQLKLITKKSPWQMIPKVGLNVDETPVTPLEEQNKFSELLLGESQPIRKQQQNGESKTFLKSGYRYSQEQINDLTNLFLPSVKSSSYKKYNKPKNQIKGMIHVGRKFLESTGILKQQIKSVSQRKHQWRSIGKTYL